MCDRCYLSSDRWPESGDKFFNAPADFIADRAYSTEALPGRVVELPVKVALAGEEGAGVATAHGDDNIASLDCVGSENLGSLFGEVDTFFAHGFDDDRIDRVGRGRSSGADFNRVAGKMVEVARGHLGATGIVDTDE